MIDRQRLLDDLKPLLKQMEADLRARCDEVAEIDAGLKREYNEARAADRTGATFEEWRADLITQVAVAWVLSCVFVRFLEDNELISPPRISGPLRGAGEGYGMQRARDERDLYFKSHPKDTDRDYLLAVFDDLAKLPGTKDVFGPHNPVSAYRNWLSGDAAQKIIEFFQKIDTDGTGELIHDFTDGQWDTRFLGDLYQDLSEAARKKYALLQTPVFVEEFILERTLEPAINEFGLAGFKMIDPACGSGHFLLGSFARILDRWRRQEPGTPDRELINRALASVYGVDLNPYAVAIARFRLLAVAMRECHVIKLKDAPAFSLNLVCGDSLLHGSPGGDQQVLGFHDLAHAYQSEDLAELKRILKPGCYHAVVANPPYITVRDQSLNEAYRGRYPEVCYRQYSLVVPFVQRLFELAATAGFVGQITANSFMKREFGKRLVEAYLPRVDLTHIIDTQLAHIPHHGTATVILLGRQQPARMAMVRLVSGLRREDAEPDPPEDGKVWRAILAQIDVSGSESTYVSVSDVPRESIQSHPWSIGGGGASELKEAIEGTGDVRLEDVIDTICSLCLTRADEVYLSDRASLLRRNVPTSCQITMGQGEHVRDWGVEEPGWAIFPYDSDLAPVAYAQAPEVHRVLWPYREDLWRRRELGGDHRELDRTWWEWNRFLTHRFRVSLSIAFAFVATHNHFVLDRGGKVFKQSAPVIKLKPEAQEDDHLALSGLLNSSIAGFWMRQVLFCKGGGGNGRGISAEAWERMLEFDATKLRRFPIPWQTTNARSNAIRTVLDLARHLDAQARKRLQLLPAAICRNLAPPSTAAMARAEAEAAKTTQQMISIQEELDWLAYRAYGLLDDSTAEYSSPPPVKLGQRAFEILMARKIGEGQLHTEWFPRHHSNATSEIPSEWPEEYRKVITRRIELIETNMHIRLVEQPEYKRRWNIEPWEEQRERALRNWLLDRLESFSDLDGRMNDDRRVTAHANLRVPVLISVAQLSDIARADKDFMQVAELYAGRMDFDVANLVGELVAAESMPFLPTLRYKPSGLDKRAAWERTWELQRLEDAVDVMFEELVARARKHEGDRNAELQKWIPAFSARLRDFVVNNGSEESLRKELVQAAAYLAEAANQNADLTSDTILKPVTDAAKRAKRTAIGDISVPPKYAGADFTSGDYWRLRGKLDVPKERWVSFPHCEGEDGTLVIAWAGYDHLQLARSIAERYELAKEQEGRKLVALLAAIGQLIPWLKQWHNDLDPAFGTRMGDYFEGYLAEEAKALGQTVADVMAWKPPDKVQRRRGGRIPVGAGGFPDCERDALLISAALSLVVPDGISEDLHLDAMILMAAPDRCRELVSDITCFEAATKPIDSEFWTESTVKWKRVRNLLSQANAITIDPHSGLILRKEPGFSKLRQRFGTAFDALGSMSITAGRAIQTATAKIQRQQDTARKREKRSA